LTEELQSGKLDEETYNLNLKPLDNLLSSSVITYWLVAAQKPVNIL
ncbi:MAG: SAM-dependent methyltransferase, partial [Microcystis panniformis]